MLISDFIQLQNNAIRVIDDKIAQARSIWDAMLMQWLENEKAKEQETLSTLETINGMNR